MLANSEFQLDASSEESADANDDAPEANANGTDAEESAPATLPEIPLDVVFDILKNERRRHVLRYLKDNDATTLSDLAEHVAALENGKEVDLLTSTERKRVYVGLYQCHLPRMDDAGVIDFDSDRGTVELNAQAAQLDEYLPDESESHRPWPLYYLSAAGAGAAAYVGSLLVPGLSAWAPSLVVLATLVCVGGCAVAHLREEGRLESS